MIESSRKHGHFDGRYPALPKLVERAWAHSRPTQAYKHWLVLHEEAA